MSLNMFVLNLCVTLVKGVKFSLNCVAAMKILLLIFIIMQLQMLFFNLEKRFYKFNYLFLVFKFKFTNKVFANTNVFYFPILKCFIKVC